MLSPETPLDLAAIGWGIHNISEAQAQRDAAFIALANPATILGLCERIRELEKLMPARSK